MTGCTWPDCGDDTNCSLGKTVCCGAHRAAVPPPAAAPAPVGPVDVLAILHDAGTEQARRAGLCVARLMDEAQRCVDGVGDLRDLRAALVAAKGGAE